MFETQTETPNVQCGNLQMAMLLVQFNRAPEKDWLTLGSNVLYYITPSGQTLRD